MAQRRATGDRRIEIADATLRIIASRGIAALTTAEIASEIGVTPGALFRHFASREAILEAAAGRAAELLDQSFPPSGLPATERLSAFVLARSRLVETNAGIARLMLSEQFALALSPRAARRLRAIVKKSHTFIVRVLSEGQESGEIRDDLAPGALAVVVMGAVQMVIHATAGAPGSALDANASRVLDTLLSLLAPVAPRAGRISNAKKPSRTRR